MEDVTELIHPAGDRFLIALRVEESGDPFLAALLFDLLPDLTNSSEIEPLVSRQLRVRIADSTHVVNSPMASSRGWLSSFNFFPCNARSRARQTLAQNSARPVKPCLLLMVS